MTNTLFARHSVWLPFSVLPSLTAVACLASLSLFGGDSGLHVATASALFVFGYQRILDPNSNEETETDF